MSPTSKSGAVSESVALLDDDLSRERCCFGFYRKYGPDSAWSWLVAFSNFVIHFLIVGLGRMSGILYVDLMNTFGVDRKTASIPFSVQIACRNLFGPLAGIVGQKYGLRNMNIFGGTAAFLGATVLFFKMDMTYIIIFWGLLFGISAACTTTLNQISIDQYFDRNRATAGGFAVSGGCVGAFIFPFLIETGIARFELQGTFLLLGSFLLFTIPAAFMLVDPPWKRITRTDSYRQNIRHYGSFDAEVRRKVAASHNSDSTKVTKELPVVNKKKIRVDFSVLRENRDIVVQLLAREISNVNIEPSTTSDLEGGENYEIVNKLEHIYSIIEDPDVLQATPSTSRAFHESLDLGAVAKKKNSAYENTDDGRKQEISFVTQMMSEKELFPIQSKLQKLYERDGSRIASSFHHDDQPRVCKILTELRKLYETLTEEPCLDNIYNKAQYFKSSQSEDSEIGRLQTDPIPSNNNNSLCTHLKTALKMHKNPVFLLICLCRAVFMLTFVPVVTIIVDFAMDQGLERSYGKFAVAALSLGDLCGRLCFGWVTDRKYLSQPKYVLIAMVLLGCNSASLPFLHNGVTILAAVCSYGVLQGSLFIRHPMLVSQFMESSEQSIGMGFMNLLSGIVGLALPAFIGYFRDTLGSYDEMFFITAIICVCVGLLWGLEPFFPAPSKAENRYQHL